MARPARGQSARLQPAEREDDADEARAVDEERRPDADLGDEDARDSRSDDPRRVEGGGVQRDRVRHVALADHLHDERLASGLIEDVREAEREPERGDVPVLDPARRDERPEQEGLAGERRLRGDEQGALRQPVGHRAGDDGEHEDRRELQGGDEPEPERRVCELQHEPRLRDRLHPAPHQRQELGDVKSGGNRDD